MIGLGVMGAAMLKSAVEAPDFVVTQGADASSAAVARARTVHPELAFSAPFDVATAEDVDVVYIATPPSSHVELAIAAMRAGKAVFCEKPLAVDIADGTRMYDVSIDTGMVNVVNFPFATMEATRYLERSLRSGAAGEILAIDVTLRYPVWPRKFQATATWVGGRAEGGSAADDGPRGRQPLRNPWRKQPAEFARLTLVLGAVAQSGSAPRSHRGGQGFESPQLHPEFRR
jgi:1,5-anhydro-D-fructose reductase (1,5-anhydro-D-mannitol-forming)